MTAQEHLTGMPTPKQDERTPGPWDLFDDRSIGCGCSIRHDNGRQWITVARGLSYEDAAFIVQACNAYGSTDALRSALEKIAGGFEGEGLEIENQWRMETARAALSGSPAPSTDRLREWMPIETAPRRGTPVLVGWSYGHWEAGKASHDCDLDAWGELQADMSFFPYPDQPTHWMPLPPAPEPRAALSDTHVSADTAAPSQTDEPSGILSRKTYDPMSHDYDDEIIK